MTLEPGANVAGLMRVFGVLGAMSIAAACEFAPLPPLVDAMDSGYRVSGTVAGMWDGGQLELRLEATGLSAPVTATVDANGDFAFDAELDNGADYAISVVAQPTAHDCAVAPSSGTITDVHADGLAVTCTGPAVDITFSAPIEFDLDDGVLAHALSVSPLIQTTALTVSAPDATRIGVNDIFAWDSGEETSSFGLETGTTTFTIAIEVGETARTYSIDLTRDRAIAQALYAKPTNADPGDVLGFRNSSVAIDGDVMVVGSTAEASASSNPLDNSAANAGAVYVFRRTATTWVQEAYLKASAIDAGDEFGSSVAVSGDTIVVGARREASSASGINGNDDDDSLDDSGAAYVFRRVGSTWVQEAYLKASNPNQPYAFGSAVAISGNTIVVGSPNEASGSSGINGNQADTSKIFSGAVYVFVRSGSTWSQQAYVKASNPDGGLTGGDNFGAAVAIHGDTLAVGAPNEDSCATGKGGVETNNGCVDAGAAYVFQRTGAQWGQRAYLKASNTDAGDLFGTSVAVHGDLLVVGAPDEASGDPGDQDDDTALGRGAAYVFHGLVATWNQVAYLKSSDQSRWFGTSVAVRGDVAAVGTGVDDGAVTIFRETDEGWTEVTVLRPTNAQPFDAFGKSIALSDHALVATSPSEDSLATGIDPTDDGATTNVNVGAVYAFW